MGYLSKHLLTAAAGLALTVAAASGANATPTGFTFNDGTTTVSNVDHLIIADPSVIIQGVGAGPTTAGQQFTESGHFNLGIYFDTSNVQHFLPGAVGGHSLQVVYTLTGHVDATGTKLVFDTGATSFLNYQVDGTTFATFGLVNPSGASGQFNAFNGTLTGNIQLTVEQLTGPTLFTDAHGNPIPLQIVNDQPTLTVDNTPIACPAGISSPSCITITAVSNSGTIFAPVPEPGTLAILGVSVFGLGLVSRRRRKAAA